MNLKQNQIFVSVCLMAIGVLSLAWLGLSDTEHSHGPYAGQEAREIASLSNQDISDIQAGRGWGFAKSAELNGYPGPRHVLDLNKELGLTAHQHRKITEIFDSMSASAKAGGAMLLEAERALDAAFRSNHVDGTVLRQLLNRAENARRELRRVHLSAHLETKPILNPQQRERYAKLRGYEPHSKH